ncbi:DUF885 family protein [Candidatus Endoriftia persephonae]|jgi:hypothetical protein|uniref:DUF885 domain-containing protein n=2 Tax=Gammaproteobacteria TaxID=1236 RepID=G2FDX2_9GAMM|nr:DUF885 family protein [Candidatus Endoriftia persephone]EGW54956.1 hypothetical protein TevJSym_ag00340 [endosymbiont of Tevnia jerichonana (vent Tica)]USF87889.1 DUF885 family protein [Candidatus Endoriftia persephone]
MSEAADFDALVAEFYQVWFRFHPSAALFAGVAGYEGQLAADGDDDVGALAGWLGNLLLGLSEFSLEALDADRQIDLQLIYGAVIIERRWLLEQDWRHRDPARYLPLRTLQELVLRQPEQLCEAVLGLLKRTPNYLRDARSQLLELPELVSSLWLAEALELLERGIPWLHRLVQELPQGRECCTEQGQLQGLSCTAAEALEDYQHFLQDEIVPAAQGSSSCGTEMVDLILRNRHQLALSGEQALQLARREREKIRRQLAELGVDVDDLQDRHLVGPELTGEQRQVVYREELARLKAFVLERELLQPPEQPCEIRLTEGCLSRIACDSYCRTEAGGVIYLPCRTERSEGGESLAEIRLRCLYAGWAGRHFLAWAGGIEAHSLVRQINPSAAFKRGWAHYMSGLLEEQDYFAEADRRLLQQRRLALAEEAVVELEYHLGDIDGVTALSRLRSVAILGNTAESRLTQISRHPTDAFMALIGVRLLEATRRRVLEKQPQLSPLQFHAKLFAEGAIALPLVVKRSFGESVWEQASREVL